MLNYLEFSYLQRNHWILLQVSISLMDIALECLSTMSGETQQTYQLTPSEIKATARYLHLFINVVLVLSSVQ